MCFKKKAGIIATFIEIIAIKYVKNPSIIIRPKNGPAKILEIQKVRDKLLNCTIIIGIITMLALIETVSISVIYCTIFVIKLFVSILLRKFNFE